MRNLKESIGYEGIISKMYGYIEATKKSLSHVFFNIIGFEFKKRVHKIRRIENGVRIPVYIRVVHYNIKKGYYLVVECKENGDRLDGFRKQKNPLILTIGNEDIGEQVI